MRNLKKQKYSLYDIEIIAVKGALDTELKKLRVPEEY